MTLLYTDPVFLDHETGQHPERPARLRAISARLTQSGLAARCPAAAYQPLTVEQIERVHDASVFEIVQEVSKLGGGQIDADTVVSRQSLRVALAAAGTCSAAVDAVIRGPEATALCLVRPPGHHATPNQSMGFCLFNNIALAARRALDEHGLNRILIVDFDVHHGNGTQDIFYAEPRVMFHSIHRYGHGFYPGTGAADETGRGAGLGFTLNTPIRYGTARPDYHARFATDLQKAADKIKPELVLVSAGFDAHADDPIGSLGLQAEDFASLTQRVLDVAKTHAGGRLVSCLEGGYNLDALAESVEMHLKQLITDSGR
jgi:acetoin utilization deacetylase AcuC-like enzyme